MQQKHRQYARRGVSGEVPALRAVTLLTNAMQLLMTLDALRKDETEHHAVLTDALRLLNSAKVQLSPHPQESP